MVRCQNMFFISRDVEDCAVSELVLYVTRCWRWCGVSNCSLSRDAEDGAVSAIVRYVTRCWRWCGVSTCSLYHEMLKMVRCQHLFFVPRDAEDCAVSALVLCTTRCLRLCGVSTCSLYHEMLKIVRCQHLFMCFVSSNVPCQCSSACHKNIVRRTQDQDEGLVQWLQVPSNSFVPATFTAVSPHMATGPSFCYTLKY
jgi:hypothetical protein